MTWVLNNFGLIGSLTLVHLRQALIALAIGFALSIPLGWFAWRVRPLRGGIVVVTGLIYTIPSLALLMFIPAFVGIAPFDESNLVIALTLYAIALLVRTVVDALASVNDDVRLAATAMGYGRLRRVWSVELPLAGPVLLAGLRVTAASTVALATVGILVGVTNLGYLFTNGLQRRIVAEVGAGILAVVLITLVLDALLVLSGRVLFPWERVPA